MRDDNLGPLTLASAVVAWSGWGRDAWPTRDEARVAEQFGAERATALMPLIRELEDDFYSSDAHLVVPENQAMVDLAAAAFRAKHPELPDEATKALAWCYSWDHK